jgi:hypothetical protein
VRGERETGREKERGGKPGHGAGRSYKKPPPSRVWPRGAWHDEDTVKATLQPTSSVGASRSVLWRPEVALPRAGSKPGPLFSSRLLDTARAEVGCGGPVGYGEHFNFTKLQIPCSTSYLGSPLRSGNQSQSRDSFNISQCEYGPCDACRVGHDMLSRVSQDRSLLSLKERGTLQLAYNLFVSRPLI